MEKKLRKKPTQLDVALLAGVSQTTVSLVLNNPDTPSVPPETRERVQEAIRSLGYFPNNAARVLRTSRTHTLACIIPMITNPFYPAFVSGIQKTAEMNGYDVITYNTHNSPEREARFLQMVQQGRVDGVIGVFFFTRARDLAPLFKKNIPVVRLEVRRPTVGEWPLDNIYVNNTAAAHTATTHLISKGHQRIAMITGPGGPRNARCLGYLQALETHSPSLEPLLHEAESYDEMGGFQGMQQVLQDRPLPSGIFAANDLMAIGVMKAMRDAGLCIPHDFAVVGFDDIPAARMVTPALTTIRQYQEEMGSQAAQMLIERLQGSAPENGRILEVPYELIVRESA